MCARRFTFSVSQTKHEIENTVALAASFITVCFSCIFNPSIWVCTHGYKLSFLQGQIYCDSPLNKNVFVNVIKYDSSAIKFQVMKEKKKVDCLKKIFCIFIFISM